MPDYKAIASLQNSVSTPSTNINNFAPSVTSQEIYSEGRYPINYFGLNNEDIYGQNQSTFDKWKNAAGKFAATTASTFTQGTAGLINGVYQWANDGKFSSFYDNEFNQTLDNWTKGLENSLPNYYTDAEKNAAWYSPKTWGTANFWSDTIFKNSGFALGAFLSGGAWSKAFGLVGKVAKGITAGGAAELAQTAEQTSLLGSNFNALNTNLSRVANQFVSRQKLLDFGANATRAGMATFGEASIEALNANENYKNELIRQYQEKNGITPEGEDLSKIESLADDVGNITFGANMALLSVTNYIQYSKLMGTFWKGARGEVSAAERNISQVALQGDNVLNRTLTAVQPTRATRILNKAKNYSTLFFSPSEAFEEGAQYTIPISAQDWVEKGEGDRNITDVLANGIKRTLTDKEGLISILSGGITGGIIERIGGIRQGEFLGEISRQRQTKQNTNNFIQAANNALSGSYIQEGMASLNRSEVLNQELNQAALSNDRLAYEDAKTDQTLNYLLPRIQYGRFDLVLDDIQGYRELASTENGYNQIIENGLATNEMEREDFVNNLSQLENIARTTNDQYQALERRYGTQLDTDNTLRYSKDVLLKMAYTGAKIDDYNKRITSLLPTINASGLDILTYTNAIANGELTEEDLQNLNNQIENKQNISPEAKDELKSIVADTLELAARRQFNVDQYQQLRDFPKENSRQSQPLIPLEDENEGLQVDEEGNPILDENGNFLELPQPQISAKQEFAESNPIITINEEEGNLEYDQANDRLLFNGREITNDDLRNQEGLIDPQGYLSTEDTRTPIVLTQRFQDNLNEIKQQRTQNQERISQLQEDITQIQEDLNVENWTAEELVSKKKGWFPQFVSNIGTLTELRDEAQSEIDRLQTENQLLTQQAVELEQLIANPPNTLQSSIDLLQQQQGELENLVLKNGTLINSLNDIVTSIGRTINRFKDIIQEKLNTFRQRNPNIPVIQTALNALEQNSPNLQAVLQQVQQIENFEITPAKARENQIRGQIQDLYKQIQDYNNQLEAKEAILNKLRGLQTEVVTRQEIAQTTTPEQIETIKENQAQEDTIQETEPTKFYPEEGKRKPIDKIFRSGIILEDSQRNTPWYQRNENFLNKHRLFPQERKENFRVILVTANNEEQLGLKGIIDYSYKTNQGKNYYKNEAEKVDPIDGAIIAVVIENDPETGNKYYLDQNGNRINEVGQETDLNEILMSKLPAAKLTFRNGQQNYAERKGINPEETLQSYIRERQSILNSSTPRESKFEISRGRPIKDKERNPIVGTLIPQEAINNKGILKVIHSDGTLKDAQGNSFQVKKGTVIVQYEDIREQANTRQLTEDESNRVFELLKKVKEPQVSKYLQGLFYTQFSPDLATIKLGKKTFTLNEDYLNQNEEEIKQALQTTFTNANDTLLQENEPFEEITGLNEDGITQIVNWQSYQAFLLSPVFDTVSDKEGTRSPSLSTSVREVTGNNLSDSNFTDKYIILDNLAEEQPRVEPWFEKTYITSNFESALAQEIEQGMAALGEGMRQGLENSFEEKIKGYVNRINAGESRESVLQGLPKSFVETVDKLMFTIDISNTLKNLPEYIRESIINTVNANKAFIEDVKNLALKRLTKNQIASQLKNRMGVNLNEAKEIVNAIRAYIGIPSMDSTSEFEEWLKKEEKNKDRIIDSQELPIVVTDDQGNLLMQQDREVNLPTPPKKTLDWIDTFLGNIGVQVEVVKDIVVNNQKLNANGVALPLQGLVLYVDGQTNALTEETMHIAVELVSQKNPELFKEMMDKITSLPIYKQVFDAYKNEPAYQTNGKTNITKIKKEAIGKQLTQTIINQQSQSFVQKWWNKVVQFFKGLFGNQANDLKTFRQAVDYILEEDLGTIRETLLKSEDYLKEIGFTDSQSQQVIELANSNITSDELSTAIGSLLPNFNYLQISPRVETHYNRLKSDNSRIEISEDEATIDDKEVSNTLVSRAEEYVKSKIGKLTDKAKKILSDIRSNKKSLSYRQAKDVLSRFINQDGNLISERKRKPADILVKDANYSSVESAIQDLINSFPEGTKFLSGTKVYSKRRDLVADIDLIAITPDGKTNLYLFQETNFQEGERMDNVERQALTGMIDDVSFILRTEYGISDFGQSRIIPFNRFENDGQIKIQIGGQDYENRDPDYLSPIPSQLESTGSPALDKKLQELRGVYKRFYNQSSKTIDQMKVNDLVNGIIGSARRLQVNKDIRPLLTQAKRVSTKMDELITEYNDKWLNANPEKFDKKEIQNYFRDLLLISQLSESLSTIDSALGNFLEDSQIKKISRETSSIKEKINDLSNVTWNFTNKFSAEKNNITGLLTPEVIKSMATRTFRGISQSNIAAVELLGKLVQQAENQARLNRSEYIRKVTPIKQRFDEWRKSKGIAAKDALNLLTQKDEKGRYIHRLIEKYSPEFYEGVKKARENKDSEWVDENIDREAYDKWFEQYKKDRTEVIEDSVNASYEYKDDEERQEIIDRRIREQIDIYDLFKGVSRENNKLKNFPKNQYSKEYQELMKPENAPALELYNLIEEQNQKAFDSGVLTDFQARTFLPFARKNLMDKIIFGGTNNIIDDAFKAFSISEQEAEFVNRDELSGEIKNRIPFYMMYDISKKRIDPKTGESYRDYSDVSTDIFQLLDLYNYQNTKYELFKGIENEMLNVSAITHAKQALETTRTGQAALSGGTIDNNLNANYFDNLLALTLYGRKNLGPASDIQLGTTSNKFAKWINKTVGRDLIDTNEQNRVISAANLADATKRYFVLKTLALKLPTAAASFLGTSLSGHLEAGTFFTKNEYWNSWLSMIGGKFGDKFGGMKDNIRVGLVDYFIPLNQDENNRHDARQLTLQKIKKYNITEGLMVFLNYADRASIYANTDALLNNTMLVNGKFENIRKYVKETSPDWSTLPTKEQRDQAKKDIESQIKELQETQSIRNIAKFNSDGILEIPGISRDSEEVAKLATFIQNLAANSTGMTGDARGGQGNVLFRMFMTFKNWMPRQLSRRFDKLRYTPGTDSYDWGRYQVFGNFLSRAIETKGRAIVDILQGTDNGIELMRKEYERQRDLYKQRTGKELADDFTQDRFIELYQQQLKSSFTEFAYMTALYAAFLSLAALAPDDEDEQYKKNFYNYSLKALDKGVDEMLFFVNPTEYYKLGNGSIMPPIGIVKDVLTLNRNLRQEVWGSVTGNEELKEKAQPTKYALKIVPLGSTVILPLLAISNAELAEELGYKETKPQNQVR